MSRGLGEWNKYSIGQSFASNVIGNAQSYCHVFKNLSSVFKKFEGNPHDWKGWKKTTRSIGPFSSWYLAFLVALLPSDFARKLLLRIMSLEDLGANPIPFKSIEPPVDHKLTSADATNETYSFFTWGSDFNGISDMSNVKVMDSFPYIIDNCDFRWFYLQKKSTG